MKSITLVSQTLKRVNRALCSTGSDKRLVWNNGSAVKHPIYPDFKTFQSLASILLENLLDKAWKYTCNAQAPEITMKRHYSKTEGLGYLISDNGVGFDNEFAEKLFLPFQRLYSSEGFPGIGIGLTTAARIVKRHGGSIWSESKKNEGASFYFVLEKSS